MVTATAAASDLFEQTVENLRQTTKSALRMQKEMYGQWAKMWSPQNDFDWTARTKTLQQDWAGGVTEMMHKHRSLLDQQYRAGIESLGEAFRVAGLQDPDELREGCQALCRKTLDLLKEITETQIQQYHEAMQKWVELCQTKP